jgi:hypothetical protein
VRGDVVETEVDLGPERGSRTYRMKARGKGSYVKVTWPVGDQQHVSIQEVARSGRIARSQHFLATRVIATVELLHDDQEADDGSPRRRSRPAGEQTEVWDHLERVG